MIAPFLGAPPGPFFAAGLPPARYTPPPPFPLQAPFPFFCGPRFSSGVGYLSTRPGFFPPISGPDAFLPMFCPLPLVFWRFLLQALLHFGVVIRRVALTRVLPQPTRPRCFPRCLGSSVFFAQPFSCYFLAVFLVFWKMGNLGGLSICSPTCSPPSVCSASRRSIANDFTHGL